MGKREIVWKHDARRTEYQLNIKTENVLYFFYNIAQRNLTKKICGKFSVLILSYINTALNQSAFSLQMLYYENLNNKELVIYGLVFQQLFEQQSKSTSMATLTSRPLTALGCFTNYGGNSSSQSACQ